jgi:hypothetical protein
VAYESELGNFIIEANAVSALMGPAFVNASQFLPLVRTETFPDTSNVIKVPISGYLVAETVAESTDYSYSASSELTDTSVTVTAKKAVQGSKFTVEADRFGKPHANLGRIGDEMSAAHGRLFDYDFKALINSISTVVTATTVLTKDNLLDASYNVFAATKGAHSGKLVGAFDFKGVNEIRKELTSITATAFGNKEMLGILGNPGGGINYAGNCVGIDIYQTDGLSTTGSDDQACVWDPALAFYAGVDGVAGFRSSVKEPSAINGLSWELLTWTFFKVAIWRNTAACQVRSDT